MENYYSRTTFLQKVKKLLQVHWLYYKAKLYPKTHAVARTARAIALVVPQLDRIGGNEAQAIQFATAFTDRGMLLFVLTDTDGGRPTREFRNGFLILRLRRKSTLATVLFFWRYLRRVEYVHAYGITGFSLLSLWIAKALKKRTLLRPSTKDDVRNIFLRNDFKHRRYQQWLGMADCFIAISEELKQEMISQGLPEARIQSIPNPVDAKKFHPPSAEERIAIRSKFSLNGEKVVLYLGRLEERKGIHILLDAWSRINRGVLWIVGDGPEEQRLRQLARDLDLSNIVFHGPTSTPLDYYHAADLFVFPSLKEGSPNSLWEAMSCGLPCIATRIGGIIDHVQDGHEGLLVEPGAVEPLAEAIQFALDHPQDAIRWSQQGAAMVQNSLELSRVMERYINLYKTLESC